MSSDLPEFDVLLKMANENPNELEALRKDLSEQLICNAPVAYQRRLRGLQFQIDMQRQKAKNPLDSCIKISTMMHNSVDKLRIALHQATEASEDLDNIAMGTADVFKAAEATADAIETGPTSAQVIPFPKA